MRKMNKFLAIALALVMIMSLSITAMADEADLTGHTYKAYKIFAGTQAADSTKLAVSGWGEGIDGPALLTALKASDAFGTPNAFADCETAVDVAEAMDNKGDKSEFAKAFAKLAYANIKGDGVTVVSGTDPIEAGYYLVVDVTSDEIVSGENHVRNLALLQQTKKGAFTIEVKVDVPEITKKVDDKNESDHSEDADGWYDSADYDIGESVPFQLTATMPSDLENYKGYWLQFMDTDEQGLTYNGDAKLYVVNGDTKTEVATAYYRVKDVTADSFTLEVYDALALKDKEGAAITVTANSLLVVEYTSTLNENAVVGVPGNPNFVKLQYSNNPNVEYKPDPTTPPQTPPPHGETPPDEAVVFTYKLTVNKTDEKGDPLKGATFELKKWIADSQGTDATVGEWVTVKTIAGEDISTFVFSGLDAGKYKLVETIAPAGYNKADDIEFTISASSDLNADIPALKEIEITGTNDIIVEKDASGNPTGNMTVAVVNRPGTLLPETGGIGTTMFYIIGGLLVAAAVVLLVTKKRMASAE